MKTYKIIFSAFAIIMAVGMMTGCGESSGENTANDTTTTTTTSATITTAETETPEETTTAAETGQVETEAPESDAETGIVTMADNPEGVYTLEECFRRRAEEYSGKRVVGFRNYYNDIPFIADLDDNSSVGLLVQGDYQINKDELVLLEKFSITDSEYDTYVFMVKFDNLKL